MISQTMRELWPWQIGVDTDPGRIHLAPPAWPLHILVRDTAEKLRIKATFLLLLLTSLAQ